MKWSSDKLKTEESERQDWFSWISWKKIERTSTKRIDCLAFRLLEKNVFGLNLDMLDERVMRESRRVAGEMDWQGRIAGNVRIRRVNAS